LKDGSDGDPIVYHGYTLTTRIKFREVIQTIAKHAFVHNEYPLVLSLEVHCSYEQQGKMAEIMH
jgi:phosphatidylinositol phospholipase C eta